MINGIILRISSIISTIDNGTKIILNRGKSKIISNASKYHIERRNKVDVNRCDSGKLSNEKYTTNAKYKIREKKIER